jgi:serine/threonine-protein kinase 11
MIASGRSLSTRPFLPPDSSCKSTHRLKKVNNYTVRAKIGSGSSSTVYLGVDERSGQKCALKRIKLRELARSPAGIAQLEREVRLMRLFDHPSILKLLEVLHIPLTDEAYLVMEYADRGSLGAIVDRHHRLSTPAIFSILKQISHAVHYLHNSGYVHQDIKPCNILIDSSGRAKLADFGIGHSFTSAAMVVGSPAYQAPEALNDSDSSDDEDSGPEGPQKEDIWALGVTLYHLLFLKLPFAGNNLFEIVASIKGKPLQCPEDCDPGIVSLIGKMLTIDPRERIGIGELVKEPLIVGAPDLAEDLPEAPVLVFKEGETVEIEGKICPDGFSFAGLSLAVPRRFSYHVPSRNVTMARWVTCASHSDGEDDDCVKSPNF